MPCSPHDHVLSNNRCAIPRGANWSGRGLHRQTSDLEVRRVGCHLLCLAGTNCITSSEEPSLHITKKQLSSCSMTCRYWANKCRPNIFHDLTLSSRTDARTLLSFIEDPESKIGSWIASLALKQREPSIPWTHLIYASRSLLDHGVSITHELSGSSPKLPLRIRSLHPSVPRPLPLLFHRCHDVHLLDLHFQSFLDLVDLTGQLTDPVSLRCTNLTWTNSPCGDAHELQKGTRRLINSVLLEDCNEHWPFVWLCVTAKRPQQQRADNSVPYIAPIDLQHVAEIVRCMSSTGKTCRRRRLIRTCD